MVRETQRLTILGKMYKVLEGSKKEYDQFIEELESQKPEVLKELLTCCMAECILLKGKYTSNKTFSKEDKFDSLLKKEIIKRRTG